MNNIITIDRSELNDILYEADDTAYDAGDAPLRATVKKILDALLTADAGNNGDSYTITIVHTGEEDPDEVYTVTIDRPDEEPLTITRDTPIIKLYPLLHDAIADLGDLRVKQFGIIHELVAERVNPILAPLGLEYRTWTISGGKLDDPDLFMLDVEFKEDKNTVAWKRAGRVQGLGFRVIDALKATTTGADSINTLTVHSHLVGVGTAIDTNAEQIKELYAQIERIKDRQGELRSRRASLKNDLSYYEKLRQPVTEFEEGLPDQNTRPEIRRINGEYEFVEVTDADQA